MGQLNIFKTIGRHPKMLDGFGRLGGFLLSGKGFTPVVPRASAKTRRLDPCLTTRTPFSMSK